MTTTTYDPVAQREEQLANANQIRLALAEERHAVKRMQSVDARGYVAKLLEAPTDLQERHTVGQLLESIRLIGPDRRRRIFFRVGIDNNGKRRRIRDLTDRQREHLADLLRDPTLLWPDTGMEIIEP